MLIQSKNYAKNLIEASANSIVCVDLEGKILDLNENFMHTVGLPNETILGSLLVDYFIS